MQLEKENKGALCAWMLININKKVSSFWLGILQHRRWANNAFEQL